MLLRNKDTSLLISNKLSLKQGYILALSLILIVATLKFAAMQVLVVRQDGAAAVINVSGRQRMLSQRTAFFSTAFMTSVGQEARENIGKDLLRTIDEFEDNHNDLIYGNVERGLPPLNNQTIYDIYFTDNPALNDLVREYIAAARVILDSDGQVEYARKALQYIYDNGPDVLLKNLDAVVKLHEQKAQEDVLFISRVQTFFWVITLIILFLEGWFLFRPMERQLRTNMAELVRREKKIKAQLDELERFTTIASHDLQEPLRKILGFSERLSLALEGKLDDKAQTYMDFISSGAHHMRGLVHGLHAYARIPAAEGALEEVDVNKVVKQCLKLLAEEVEASKAIIKYQDLPVVVYNRQMIATVFEDLIGNAIKYRGAQNLVINISACRKDTDWIFCVADNGIGIDEKFFERIFTMFQRLHRKEDIEGTGLGLAIVKKIVEHHGGNVWVESELGLGSKFYFTVPKDI